MLTKTEILKIEQIFNKNLNIPEYQRPYKWQKEQVQQLLDDLLENQDRDYRIGSVIIHKEDENFYVVDGQQRLITLALILNQSEEYNKKVYSFLQSEVELLSVNNILENNTVIKNYINLKNLSEDFYNYIISKCEMVYIELDNIDEAFQFFDSQNARGKPLKSYDLLKAYHLREMKDEEQRYVNESVENWEKSIEEKDQSATLDMVINETLFKLRCWHRGGYAEIFSKDDIHYFKGVSKNKKYPYLYNISQDIYQIRQPIINGKKFFDYIDNYRKFYNYLFHPKSGCLNNIVFNIDNEEKGLLDILNSYKGNQRAGDWYLSILFKCTVLFYYDKFGESELDQAVKVIFKWVYKTRVEQTRIYFSTIANQARDNTMFKIIEYAYEPKEIINYVIEPVGKEKVKFDNVGDLKNVLVDLGAIKNGQ